MPQNRKSPRGGHICLPGFAIRESKRGEMGCYGEVSSTTLVQRPDGSIVGPGTGEMTVEDHGGVKVAMLPSNTSIYIQQELEDLGIGAALLPMGDAPPD